MKKRGRRSLLIGIGVLLGVLAIGAIGLGALFDVNRFKPQIEAQIKKFTGMDLKINGKISLKIFPRIRIAIKGAHLRNQGGEILAADTVEVAPRLLQFVLHRKVHVTQVSIISMKLRIEENTAGRMNYEAVAPKRPSDDKPSENAGKVDKVHLRDGEFIYVDRSTGQSIEARGLNFILSKISWDTTGKNLLKSLAAQGEVQSRLLKTPDQSASNMKARFQFDHGLAHLDSMEMTVFGGTLKGTAQIDVRGAVPRLKINQAASHVDLGQALPQHKNRVAGTVDAIVDLTASGKSSKDIMKTANGSISLHGQSIVLRHIDLDKLAADLKSAQGLNLVNLATLFGSSLDLASDDKQAESVVQKLVSNWQIHDGIARADDVAFSTAKTTVAFKGEIDLANQKYRQFHVATVDQNGCAKNKLEVVGSLNRPHPAAGSIGRQISESHLGAAGKALGSVGSTIGGVFGSKDEAEKGASSDAKRSPAGCDLFYSGSLIQSKK